MWSPAAGGCQQAALASTGWYQYDAMAEMETSLAAAVGRYCGLYATVGDRRLETHLLGGLLVCHRVFLYGVGR